MKFQNFLYSMRIVCENKKRIYLRWWWGTCDNQINGWIVILCVVTKTLKKFHMNKISTVNFIQRDLLGRENERQILWKNNKNRIIFVIVHFPSNKTILEDHSVGRIWQDTYCTLMNEILYTFFLWCKHDDSFF